VGKNVRFFHKAFKFVSSVSIIVRGERRERKVNFRRGVIGLISAVLVFLMFSSIATPIANYSGLPKVDRFLYKSYEGALPETIVNEFIAGVTDWIGGPGRADLLEAVASYGETFMNPMAEFGFMPINCRDYKETSGLPNLPLNDSAFRVALSYIYGMDEKDADIYAYVKGDWTFAIGNPVPPAQEPWYNESIQMPAYTNYDQAWTILQEAGYTINEDGALCNPNGQPVRDLEVWYSTGAIFWRDGPGGGLVRNFNEFIAYIGATSPTMTIVEKDFITLVYELLLYHDYDINCLGLTNLGRFVDWLYDLLHSKNDVPGGWNFAGIHDPRLDELTEIILTSLNVTEVIEAASDVQEIFVNELMPWFPCSSGMEITTVASGDHPNGELTNIIEMNAFGPQNDWSWMALHWTGTPGLVWPGGDVKRALGDAPSNLNPYYEDTLYGWQMLDRAYTGLIGVAPLGGDPTALTDIPYVATDFEVAHWTSIPELGITEGSMATFYLRQDVLWHDLTPLTAYDAVENMLFMAKWKPGRYSSTWANLVYSEADGPYKFNTYFYTTSLYYAYYVAGVCLLSPKHVLERLENLIEEGVVEDPSHWEPATTSYEDFMGYPPPSEYPFMKAVVGSGPFVFNYYDESLGTGEVDRFHEFFVNAPALGAVVGEWRIDPDTAYTYKVLVQNMIAKENVSDGTLTDVTVNVKIYEDDSLVYEVNGINLIGFNFTYLGPYTTDALPAGMHTIKVEVYDDETGALWHTYTHEFAVTLRQDVTTYSGDVKDIKVDMRDVGRAAKAFGSKPAHPRWDPPCDTNDDFKVDMKDIGGIARKFGWEG